MASKFRIVQMNRDLSDPLYEIREYYHEDDDEEYDPDADYLVRDPYPPALTASSVEELKDLLARVAESLSLPVLSDETGEEVVV